MYADCILCRYSNLMLKKKKGQILSTAHVKKRNHNWTHALSAAVKRNL